MANFTGYNPEKVTSAVNGIVNGLASYDEAANIGMQNRFVVPMADLWACEQAQNYFAKYKEVIDSLFKVATEEITSIIDHFNSAGEAYASATESSWSRVSYDMPSNASDTSVILPDIDGNKGIDRDAATQTANVLAQIKDEAITALSAIQNAANDSGFLGANNEHQEAINTSVKTIQDKVASTVETLTVELKNAIDETAAAYGELESKAAQAASGAGA